MTVQELYAKYGTKRGFTEEETKEFDQICGWCYHFDTSEDEEYQSRIFNMIDSIIHNPSLDYMSRLDKIDFLVDLNKTWREWQKKVENCRDIEGMNS